MLLVPTLSTVSYPPLSYSSHHPYSPLYSFPTRRSSYLAYTLAGALPLGGASFYVAVALAALAVGAVGTLVEIALLRRVYRAPELYQLLLTFALVLVVSDVVKLVWGSENKTGPSAPGLTGAVRVAA